MKRAQGGLNAAILIAIIGGLILAYVILLPEDEREALLENKSIEKVRGSNGGSSDSDKILLREFPGRIDTVEDIDDKQIPNVFLFETTNAKELDSINPFIVRSGWFDKKPHTASFSISDLANTDNVLLSFQAKKHEGVLTIMLNDRSIFESDISGAINPIKLDKESLNSDNTLRFSVSTVGMKFWKTNEYQIEDVKIIADITDKSNQQSTSVFTLTNTELFNAEEANLRFVPYCAGAGQVGTLNIDINGREVFSAVPVCEDAYKQPLPIGLLKAGQNTISMQTAKGSYSIEQVRVEFDEEDIDTNVYFFELNQTKIDEINKDGDQVTLTIEFIEDKESKRADINVNNRFFTLDQDERAYTEVITDELEDGNNFVEIIPRTLLDIKEVTVRIEDKDD